MNEGHAQAVMAEKLMFALQFAAEKHRHQRRKDSEATPYINHPIAVAQVLVRDGKVDDPVLIQAAILHDTLEDTDTTAMELDDQFGNEVRRLVEEVTDDKSLPKAERKRLQIEHAPHLSTAAKKIKLADKICNIGDLSTTQPKGWSKQRKLEYLDWACQVIAGCRGVNGDLEERFDSLIQFKRQQIS